MTISKAWAMALVWSRGGNFLCYAKFSLSGRIQHGVLNIHNQMEHSLSFPMVYYLKVEQEQVNKGKKVDYHRL